jgi:hypothetical protein
MPSGAEMYEVATFFVIAIVVGIIGLAIWLHIPDEMTSRRAQSEQRRE